MNERPSVVMEIRSVFVFNGGLYLLVALAGILGFLVVPNVTQRFFICIFGLLFFCLGSVYVVLGWGFYYLRPWAYSPTKRLVKMDRLSVAFGLPKKVEQPEVRCAFGLDENHEE